MLLTTKDISTMTKEIVVAALNNQDNAVYRDAEICALYEKVFATVKKCAAEDHQNQ